MTYESHQEGLAGYLLKKEFNDEWRDWIRVNLQAGCDKNGMFKILWDEGFRYGLIKDALEFEPILPLDQIINPLKPPPINKAETAKSLFIPNAEKWPLDRLEFYILDDFLNKEECEKLIALTMDSLRPSTITEKNETDKFFRTSRSCDLGLIDDDLIKETNRRICAVMGLDPAYSETIQGQHYEVGQEFKAHTDYFEAHELSEFSRELGRELGQRSYTFMIYLNDVEDGGETSFPNINQTITPKHGRAVIWNSLNPDGTTNQNSMHQGHPVKKGCKTIITKWFRTQAGLPVLLREINENISNHTPIGFKKDVLPKTLFDKITTFYHQNRGDQIVETAAKDFIEGHNKSETGSSLVELPQSLRDEINACLKPDLETWSGITLEPTFVYGIRLYHMGATLKEHRDRVDTHIISVIINVDQEVNEDWPLAIEDNYYRRQEIFLRPGDVVFYEGARLLHGRPKPLDGVNYANIFCHFKPVHS